MPLKDVFATVNQMREDGVIKEYALGGAVGATFFLDPVATVDVDIFVFLHPEPGRMLISLTPIYDYLRVRGCVAKGEYVEVAGWPVQFLPAPSPLVEEAIREAVMVALEEVPVRIFTAEHLAAIALETGRSKDKSRLLQFVESGVLDHGKFMAILKNHHLVEKWRQFEGQFSGAPIRPEQNP